MSRCRVSLFVLARLVIASAVDITVLWAQPDPGNNQGEVQNPGQWVQPEAKPLNVRVLGPDGAPLRSVPIKYTLKGPGFTGGYNSSTSAEGYLLNPGGLDGEFLPRRCSIYVQVRGVGAALLWDSPERPILVSTLAAQVGGAVNGNAIVANAVVGNAALDNTEKPQIWNLRLQPSGMLRVTVRVASEQSATERVVAEKVTAEKSAEVLPPQQPRRGAPEGLAIGGAYINLTIAPPDTPVPGTPSPNHPADPTTAKKILDNDQFIKVSAQQATRDGDGLVEVTDLSPGVYAVTVLPVQEFVPVSTVVEIKPGQTTDLSMELAREIILPLKVRVRDDLDQPVRNTELSLSFLPMAADHRRFENGIGFRWAHTNADGEFVLYPARTGRWKVSSYNGVPIHEQEIEIQPTTELITLVADRQGDRVDPNRAPQPVR